MQQNKYLDELGVDIKSYGTNFMPDDDPRRKSWDKEIAEYGFSSVETWNMDRIFAEWLYSHMMMYKERNNVATDKEFVEVLVEHEDSFEYVKKTATEVMDEIIEGAKAYLMADTYGVDEEAQGAAVRFKTAVRWFADTITYWWW